VERPDLDLYAARIGFKGPFAPTPSVLRDIHRRHPLSIPFENLAALGGEAPSLDLADIERKLLRSRRGGWCFEHNRLLWTVLEAIGFSVTALAARVLWQQPARARPGRSHMLLLVGTEEGEQLVDVGFGGLTATAPLRLRAEIEQDTPHGRFRLRQIGAEWQLEALLPQGPVALYRFDLTPQQPVDYGYANWYLATHPQSPFATSLILARVVESGRHAYRQGEYTWRPLDAPAESRRIESPTALRRLLDEAFQLDIPAALDDARLAALLHNAGTVSFR
jgi:N-hydroxyarylamine O-acetyltransferase